MLKKSLKPKAGYYLYFKNSFMQLYYNFQKLKKINIKIHGNLTL